MRKKILIAAAVVVALIIVLVFGISSFVTLSTSGSITGSDKGHGIDERTIEESKSIKPDCILVLGCAVWLDNKPSPMLKDRLDTAIALYKKGVAPKLLLSRECLKRTFFWTLRVSRHMNPCTGQKLYSRWTA